MNELAINNRGAVVGTAWNDFTYDHIHGHAFIWQLGRMTDLGTLGGRESRASAVNDRGQVVGRSTTRQGAWHAFLWQKGTMIDLSTLTGGKSSGATGLNDHGQIIGWSTTPSGREHAVMWRLRRK